MKFGRQIRKTPEWSIHILDFMQVCLIIHFSSFKPTPKITRILMYQAKQQLDAVQ